MAEVVRLANSEADPVSPPAFVMTETARNIYRSLKMMERLSGFRIGLICGPPGIGKTVTIEVYVSEEPLAYLVTGAGGEADEKTLSEDLCRRWGAFEFENKSLNWRRHKLVSYARNIKVLILDEAQHYSLSALEWIRAVCEEAGCNLVFVGDAKLFSVAICNPQIKSRAVLPRLFTSTSAGDVPAVCKAHGLDRDGIPKELERVSMIGGLREVRNVIELATIFAEGKLVQGDEIRAAMAQLELAGGK
ncbi:MAG: AAA family ATPase [Paracoccaceae bacterium]